MAPDSLGLDSGGAPVAGRCSSLVLRDLPRRRNGPDRGRGRAAPLQEPAFDSTCARTGRVRLGHSTGRGRQLMYAAMSRIWRRAVAVLALASFTGVALAQPGPPGRPPAPPKSPRESAQIDLTGYWVALVTEDWAWRMITAPKGDATSVPLNPAGRRVAAEWDPERDAANGEACRPFGAAALMRMPLRLHVTWQNDNTFKIETDAGQQTRLFHFAPSAAANAAP